MCIIKIFIFLAITSVLCDKHPRPHGTRKLSTVSDEMYDALVQICKGKSLPQKCDRSKVQKAALMRFWRGRGRYSLKVENGREYLYFDDKKLIKYSEVKDIVNEEYHRCKGTGARKIHHTLKDIYHGLSEEKIQNLFNQKNCTTKETPALVIKQY